MKKVMGMLIVVSLLLGELAVQHKNAQAADVNKKAGKAFAKALIQKKIKYDGTYCLCDINFDGIKELIVERKSGCLHYVIWKYANRKVSKLADFDGEGRILTYDKKTKTFWNLGDGDGAWMCPYKLKNGKFKETGTWYGIRSEAYGEKAEKNTKKGTKKISVKKYRKIEKHIVKNNAIKMKKMGGWDLIAKLQDMPVSLNLPTPKGKFYGASYSKRDDFGLGDIVSEIRFKGNKMIVKGSLIEATSKEKLHKRDGNYFRKATRTFRLDKKFAFYGSGGDTGIIRYSLEEGKRMCKEPSGLGLEFKVKNKKLVSLTFCS